MSDKIRRTMIEMDVRPDSWPGDTVEVEVEFEVHDQTIDEINLTLLHVSTDVDGRTVDLDWMLEYMQIRASMTEIISDELLGELYDARDAA